MVTSWLCGFFVKSPCLALNRKTPAEQGRCSDFFLYWQKSPFRKGAIKGDGAPFMGFEVAENGRRAAHSTS